MDILLVTGIIAIFIYNYYKHKSIVDLFKYKFTIPLSIDPRLALFLQQKNAYLKSEEWEIKRNNTKVRDNFTCQICGNRFNLEVHHMNGYDKIPNESLSCLITLCHQCHTDHHEKYGYPQTYKDYMTWNVPITNQLKV